MLELKQELETILAEKKEKLKGLEEGTVGFSILQEEIQDAEYCLDSFGLEETELTARLRGVYAGTTSGRLYEALEKFYREV